MSVQLTRRWFLFGSAAVIAATQIPNIVKASNVSYCESKLRRINEILLGSISNSERTDELITTELLRDWESPSIFNIAINARGFYRWWALPGNEIIAGNKPLILNVESDSLSKFHIELADSNEVEIFTFSQEDGIKLEHSAKW